MVEPLALDLAYLRLSDFVTLYANGAYVQVIQNPLSLRAELKTRGPITEDQGRALVHAGWREPQRGEPVWVRDANWPLRADAARQLAHRIIDAARAFVAPDIAQVKYNARNYDTWEPIEPVSLAALRRSQ
ncbi:TY-Chap domain-containing protein [Rhizomonospora bruguierae]|uniref:TY-Chap domain-containing protein n=1 Tax=Rhizomonospora bruguierae TaxID=1581705 RepID=UPI001BCD2441|nr:hypothetical protein [Micromonospora sp. NBRC 107566]